MFGKKVKTENGLYGIIGLGRFGYALAQTLSESGKDLIIIDENESKINFLDVKDCLILVSNSFSGLTSYENQTTKQL